MVTHDNIHIPGESFPHWTWFVIEFVIVLAVSALISREIMGVFEDVEETMKNWIYFGLLTSIFGGWYIVIRGFIIKKPILTGRRKY